MRSNLLKVQENLIARLEEFKQIVHAEDIPRLSIKYGIKRWPLPVWAPSPGYGQCYEQITTLSQTLFYDERGLSDLTTRGVFEKATGIRLECLLKTYRDTTVDDGLHFLFENAFIYIRIPFGHRFH